MPGGAANVARNLRSLGAMAGAYGVVGPDPAGRALRRLLEDQEVNCDGLLRVKNRPTCIKTRIIAHHQQVVRMDRETRSDLDARSATRLIAALEGILDGADAVIVGDYGKGVVTQAVLDAVKKLCRPRGLWVSLDPKPVHHLDLAGLSLITPNRKEAFELAGLHDSTRATDPLGDPMLMRVAETLLEGLAPAVLLITLGDLGMHLCQRGRSPVHIPTVAQEVFDVSGAGDTVIASFTLAIAAGASPLEAAIFSNHAAGVVVGKSGTAAVKPEELLGSFERA